MQTAAMTSQAALIGSPRERAMTPKAIAPTTATAVQISLSRSVMVSPLASIPSGVALRRANEASRHHFVIRNSTTIATLAQRSLRRLRADGGV